MKKILAAILVLFALSGCATPLSYREKGFVTGAAIGGGTGSLIDTRTGHPRLTAAIGAGVGALAGALIGSAIDGSRQVTAPGPAKGTPSPQAPAAPVPEAAPVIQVPGSYGDPTAGVFMNGTPWRVRPSVDWAPGQWGGVTFTLGPGQAQPAHLDIGPHRITARPGWTPSWAPASSGGLTGRSRWMCGDRAGPCALRRASSGRCP